MLLQDGSAVIDLLNFHRPNYTEFIDDRSHVRKQLADRQSAFAIVAELPGRLEQVTRRCKLQRRLERQRLAIHFRQLGFWIERIDVRYTAVHEQEDDVFRLRLEMRIARSQRIAADGIDGDGIGSGSRTGNRVQHSQKRRVAEPTCDLPQQIATA